jgi:hypothetical protein
MSVPLLLEVPFSRGPSLPPDTGHGSRSGLACYTGGSVRRRNSRATGTPCS